MKSIEEVKNFSLIKWFDLFSYISFLALVVFGIVHFYDAPSLGVWYLIFLLFLIGSLKMYLFPDFYNFKMNLKTRVIYGFCSLFNFIEAFSCLWSITMWNFGPKSYFYFKLNELFAFSLLSFLFGFGAYKSKRFPFFSIGNTNNVKKNR